ncbi:MGMT family protein [Streptomyces bambusae]|uniref:MGMT family protein n=1 Tax=Streptomyces bambusae TaxID=1550616 RepID=UPI001CFFD20C|nr:MGMT family protein [Streptomyces bambusae]MCB5169335.1 MGMT family protein [Streptomyces bambusae]
MSDAVLPELPEYAERVLEVAERIPPGRVMTYGDVAEWLAQEDEERPDGTAPATRGGPRQVGRAMSLYGGAVPWWRVVRADGTLLPGHELRALAHYREEGTPLRPAPRSADGHVPRLDLRRARWDGTEGTGTAPVGAGPG